MIVWLYFFAKSFSGDHEVKKNQSACQSSHQFIGDHYTHQ